MKQKWYDIDKMIYSCFEEINPSRDYNQRLFEKMGKKKDSRRYIMAYTFILSGCVMILNYIFDFKCIEYWIKYNSIISQFNIYSFIKLFERVV